MKKKLILFDWGNIVESLTTGYSCHNAWNDLFLACGYTGDEAIYNSLSRYRLGCIGSVEEFENTYNQISRDFNFNTTYEQFINLYKEIFDKIDYYKDVADYEISLKDKCYIAILSNLTVFDKERLDKQVNLSQYDYVFLSFELGLKKPEMDIYIEVEKQLPFEPKDILFIDDREDNILMASKMGWQTLQATGLELDKIKDTCENFLKQD